ncbi:DUF6953 family protein [Aeromonas sobria]|uniref:DUF6953 family protein n=1 Tax=Aeromonas sobria TaxID=646 RepID=UPI001CA36AB7|nr:hypothetical protein [Aeromonas sobria]
MTPDDVSKWMISALEKDGCVYQDSVVDLLVKSKNEHLLKENNDGNQVLAKVILDEFFNATRGTVVWVRSGFYWRWRVEEDEEGRDARG